MRRSSGRSLTKRIRRVAVLSPAIRSSRARRGALNVEALPRVIAFDNCLLQESGPLVNLANKNQSAPLRVHVRQSTLRESGAIARWTSESAKSSVQPTWMIVEDSVFAPSARAEGLLQFTADPPVGWERLLKITGEGSLLRTGSRLAFGPSGPLDASALRVEGLMTDDFEFAAPVGSPEASTVTATQIPRSSPTPPGIDPSRFPQQRRSPVVRQASHEYNPR